MSARCIVGRCVGVAVLLAAAGGALGQNANGDGRLLDRNTQVGAGRVNPQRVGGVEDQIRFNNAVITGNAAGGKAFRGYVGYRATTDFGGSVGSDANYSFRRDSVQSALTGAGVRASDALRYQFALTTTPGVPGYEAGNAAAGVPQRFSTAISASPMVLRSTADYVANQTFRPAAVGRRYDQYGAEYVAQASPLLGVSWVKTAESPLSARPLGGARTDAGAGLTPPINATPGQPPRPDAPGIPGERGETRPAGGADVRGLPVLPGAPAGAPSPTGTPSGPGAQGSSVNATPPVGVQAAPSTRVTPVATGVRSAAYTGVLNRFDSALRTGAGESRPTTTQPGAPGERIDETSYEAQMERLRAQLRGEPWPPKDRRPAGRRPGEGITPERAPDGSVRQPAPAEEGAGEAPAEQAPKTLDDLLPSEVARALRAMREQKVGSLVLDDPRREGDRIAEPELYRSMMLDGQRMLGDGRYFDAEEAFVRALSVMTGDPMASAGRIHAQIGAGLYVSAAANLRRLLVEHPEMTGVRYEANLLPGEQRSLRIIGQLRSEIDSGSSALGRDAALLLAYIAYQRGEGALVDTSLRDFTARIAPGPEGAQDRALAQLLRAAWSG